MNIQEFKLASVRAFHQLKTPLLIGAILGFAVGLVIIQNNTNKSVENTNKVLEEYRQESSRHQHQMQVIIEAIETRTKGIDDHLDCILEYFSTERRGGLFIEDIDKCRLKRSKTPVSQTQPPKRVAITPVAPQPSPSPSPQPREADRSFLDCSTTELRKRLKKTLDKETYKRICK